MTNEFLEAIGFRNKGYQENRRIQYLLDGVELDIDTWPMLPTYLELDGPGEEEVVSMVERLQLNSSNVTSMGVQAIYKHYGIDLPSIKILRF